MIYLGQQTWHASSPTIYAQFSYEKYRSGTSMFYRFQTRMWLNANSWYNDRIRGIHYVNGAQAYNGLIKGSTTTSGWDVTITTSWIEVPNKLTGTTPYAITIYDDNTGLESSTYSYTLDIDSATPIVTISEVSRTNNSITFSYVSSGPTEPTSIKLTNGTTTIGTYTTNPFTATGLSPKTLYGDLKAYGYSAAGWGVASNSLSITTYPNTVTISSVSVTNIGIDACLLSLVSSSSVDTYSTEYSIYDSTGNTLLLGPYLFVPASWTKSISSLTPETGYVAKFRVRTNSSLIWSGYSSSNFSTLTDQAQVWVQISGTATKGKLYVNAGGTEKEVKKVYVNVDGTWVESINN